MNRQGRNRDSDDEEFDSSSKRFFSSSEHAEHAMEVLGTGTSGPIPAPPWLISDAAAEDRELGIVKTGKEAVVTLVERSLGDRAHLMARKTYREPTQRAFRKDSVYRTQRTGRGRQQSMLAAGGVRGTFLRAAEWRSTEFAVLSDLWSAGLSVPYPIAMTGDDILMEYLGDETGAAPRLVSLRPEPDELRQLWEQILTFLSGMFGAGYVHGDLSAYNILVWDQRVWFIDFPQSATVSQSLDWPSLLVRDIENVAAWFLSRGLTIDQQATFHAIAGPSASNHPGMRGEEPNNDSWGDS